ncbi:MAG: hypothetical protein NZ742_01320 [Acidobacteria bacterium]|nr:hypothetical protein [Acidobacteriota bacterium]MDW7983500.1 hypothetical protein [Acidobacteriota bacterium]
MQPIQAETWLPEDEAVGPSIPLSGRPCDQRVEMPIPWTPIVHLKYTQGVKLGLGGHL